MSYNALLNQTVTLYGKSGRDQYGRETFSSGSSIKVRFQAKQKTHLMPDGSVQTIDAFMHVKATDTINRDDRVDYNGESYKVLDKYEVPGANGVTHHVEVNLKRWQT